MRVLAGALKGQRLTTPRGRTTRPTADQDRIACLDTLMPFLDPGPFLDLFAGAGGSGAGGRASLPPQYLSAIVAMRLTRLPRLLARSALTRVTKASSLKVASWPNAISRSRK